MTRTMPEIDVVPVRATAREWTGLAVLALACLLYSMDLTVLYLAVPSLSADLQPTSTQLLWITDIYGFMVAGFLITMGTLGDRIGRRRLLMLGAAAFGAGSVAAAFSTSAEMLIATRALLGIAGATLAPGTLSLIRTMFRDDDQRRFAISVWITSFTLGGALGPLFGGVMIERLWWGSVFLLAVPVMIALLILAPIVLPEYRDPNAGRGDPLSAVMSLGAVLAVIYGLKRMAEQGLTPLTPLAVLFGIALGVAFVRRQKRLAHPMIDVGLFRLPGFSASLVAYMMGVFGGLGTFLFTAQYLQLVLGMSPLVAGLWTLPSSVAFIASSMLAPALARRVPHAYAMTGGLLVAALGMLLLARIDSGGVSMYVIASCVMSLGFAPVVTLTTDVIIGSAPPERAGAASAISETSAEFGGALGIAILGSIGTAVYRASMADRIPAALAPGLAEHARATLGGAIAAVDRAPPDSRAALLSHAREAFTDALQAISLIGCVAMLATAILVFALLRDARPAGH